MLHTYGCLMWASEMGCFSFYSHPLPRRVLIMQVRWQSMVLSSCFLWADGPHAVNTRQYSVLCHCVRIYCKNSCLLLQTIAESLETNKTLKALNLESNYISGLGIIAILDAVNITQVLTELKVCNQVGGHFLEFDWSFINYTFFSYL